MQDLRFIEHVENSLIFMSETGQKFQVQLSEQTAALLRNALKPKRTSTKNVSPREIQSRLRAGESAEAIAQALEIEVSDVSRYETPILAERSFILKTSQSVEVRTSGSGAEMPELFGPVIENRILKLSGSITEWSAWKDSEDGWMVSAKFDADGQARDAVWSFDHRKTILNPVSADAVSLSKQDDLTEKLIPTLRVVEQATPAEEAPKIENEDSETELSDKDDLEETFSLETDMHTDEYSRRQKIEQRAITTEDDQVLPHSETADLLEALRRRRSKRENLPSEIPDERTLPAMDELEFMADIEEDHVVKETIQTKKGRPSVPSWEEILFGQKTDESDEDI